MEKIEKAQPKFKTTFLKKEAPKGPRLKKLKKWCLELHRFGLVPCYGRGSYGNLSFRVRKGRNEFIITNSGLRLKNNLKDKDFFDIISVDMASGRVRGYGLVSPSSESLLHFAIYRKRKDVNAIFHGHCAKLLEAASACGIPQTSRQAPYGTAALVRGVLKMLGRHQFIMMKNHGFISLGKNMDDAGLRAIETVTRKYKGR